MKRDLELIRKLLLAVEEYPHGWPPELPIDGYTDEQIGFHCYLIVDSGYAVGRDCSTRGSKSPEWMINHLTSAGYDFLDAIRNDTIWRKVKDRIKEIGASVPFEVVKAIAVGFLQKVLLT